MSVSEFSDLTSRRSKSSDHSDHSDRSRDDESWDCDDHSDHQHCDDRCRRNKRCGLKHSSTPVGVWNLLYQYDTDLTTSSTTTTQTNCHPNNCHPNNCHHQNNCHTQNNTVNNTVNNTMNQTMNIERPTQLLLNAGGTFINATTPDLNNNPFGALLSLGMGVWREMGNRKLRLDETHIAYRASNGAPTVYYRVEIIMKLSRSGTKARFHGRAIPKNLDDPTLCSDTDGTTFCFSGCGYKVLEPHR